MEGPDAPENAAAADAAGGAHQHPSEWGNLTNAERDAIVTRIMHERGMTEASATYVVTNVKCEECKCAFGQEVTEDACMCSCHCPCCCPPMFRCHSDCACSCECHYEAIPESEAEETSSNSSDGEDEGEQDDDSIVSATPPEDDANEQQTTGTYTLETEKTGEEESPGSTSHGDTAKSAGLAANGVTAEKTSAAPTELCNSNQADDSQQENGEQAHPTQQQLLGGDEGDSELKQPKNATREQRKPNSIDETDEDMMKAPALPLTLDDRSTGQVYHLLQEQLQASEESAKANGLRLVAELFSRTYKDAVQPGQTKQKPNKLPQLTAEEVQLLHALVTTVIQQRKYTFQRVLGLLKELALASVKSKWSFTNILNDRIAGAKEEKSSPANEWSQRATTQANRASQELTEAFRFDPRVFADEDATVLREICTQHHVFPTTSRQPTPNEWRIIVGMMDGTIIHKAIPTFLKRCCEARQMAWIQTQIRDRAEGELWARLPPSFIVYDHNQTSKRIIGQIRRDATRLKWPDEKLFRVLGLVKAAAYDKKKHSIHLFFFTKMDAAIADGIVMPYRNAKITLRNPDADLPERGTEDDDMTGKRIVRDGLVNDRYQAFHKARFTNLTRTMDIAALTEYLAKLTTNEIKIDIPIDAYGPESDWSQTWDFYATTPSCPTALAKINRIVWDGHHIWILHNPGQQAPPCHQCAKLGHQAAACTTPETEWINEHTIVVTMEERRQCETLAGEQRQGEDDWDHFLRLGTAVTTAPSNDQHEDSPKQGNDGEKGQTDATGSNTETPKHEDNNTIRLDGQTGAEGLAGQTTEGKCEGKQQSGGKDEDHDGQDQGLQKEDGRKNTEDKEWIMVGNKKTANSVGDAQKRGSNQGTKDTHTTGSSTGNGTQVTRSSLGNILVIEVDAKKDKDTATSNDTDAGSTESTDKKQNTNSNDGAPEKIPSGPSTADSEKGRNHKTKKTGGQHAKGGRKQFDHHETEEEALQSAIKAVQLQLLTDQLNQNVDQHADQYDREHLKKKIDGALQHVTLKASKRWILNALDGMLTKTPETGNCQYHAATEAIFQRDILQEETAMQTAMVDHTVIQKYALLVASEVIPSGEKIGTNLSAIVDGSPAQADEDSVSTTATRWKEYYRDVALSKSGVRDVVEKRLWGGHDTQRTLAMVRHRPVFNIKEVDSRTAYVQYYYPWKTAAGTLTAKQAQPGLDEWLQAIKKDVELHKTAPLVLTLSGQHYQAVLFDKQRRVREAKPAPVLKTPTLPELWAHLPTVDELIAAKRKPRATATSEGDGPTREELLQSNPKLDPTDLIGVLGQSNWSTRAKQDAVAILVSGAPNINELLAFAPDDEAEDNTQGELMSAEEMEMSDSSFESLTQRSEVSSGQAESQPTGSSESQSSTQSQAVFQTETGRAYRQQADDMWSGVQREWTEQYPGEVPPDLWNYDRLAHWAKHKSSMLLEAGRWATNPFTLLEHLKVTDIKACIEEERQAYLVSQLKEVVETIADVQVRNELRDWLHTVQQPASVNARRGQLRNETRWAQLRIHAARFVGGPTALPFVKREYSPTCAYVLILDALFADIPRLAFRSSTSVELPETVRMTDAFQYVPAFRAAFTTAVAAKTWGPIKEYFEMLMAARDAEVNRN